MRRRLAPIVVIGILVLVAIFVAAALLPGVAVIIILFVLLALAFAVIAIYDRGGA